MSHSAPSRRKFLKRSAQVLVAGGVLTMGYTWRIEPHWVQVVRRPLPIERLPAGWVGATLVQISDLHIGPIVDDEYLRSALAKVNDCSPDVVVITGDFMSSREDEQIDHVADVLSAGLKPAKRATLAVLGNHDYGHTWRDIDTADALTARLTSLGISVLRGRSREIDGLTFTGLDDYWSPRFDGSVLQTLRQDQADLVLAHNPDTLDLPIWAGYRGWVLSGHTHGGQCKPPFFAAPMLPVKNKRYAEGAVDAGSGRTVYINRGLGYLHRVRFNVRPEITVFTLARA